MIFELVAVLFVLVSSDGLNNGLGRTPPMGWNSWYQFGCNYNETMLRETVDSIIATGLADLGYQYVNLDDCWQIARDSNGTIQVDPRVFPNGIPSFIDYVHSRKLKFGLYSDAGYKTCGGRPGSLGYEKKDAETYASWGVDFLKYDNCYSDGSKPEVRYPIMRDALNQTGRPIFYSLCEWGVDTPALWASDVGNCWRTADDIRDTWDAMIATMDINNEFADQAGPGGWNDPDMLRIGDGGMTDLEYFTYFSLWSISKSPLLIGCDIRKMNNVTRTIYSNPEVIAINQDSLGVQGRRIAVLSSTVSNQSSSIVMRPCSSLPTMFSRQQWKYNSEDQTIRSTLDDRCLTINHDQLISSPCHNVETNDDQKWLIKYQEKLIVSLHSRKCLSVNKHNGQMVEITFCDQERNQLWIWNETNQLLVNPEDNKQCLTVQQDLEIWAGPLADGSKVVLLLNRNSTQSESITVRWSQLGWLSNQIAIVRDLWMQEDIGLFKDNYTSPHIDRHGVQMLKMKLI